MKREILKSVFNTHKNLIVSGDISTCKTRKVIMPLVDEMISKNQSVLFLDPKEEYYKRYKRQLEDNNYKVLVINLRDFEKSDGWNPLELPYVFYRRGNVEQAIDHLEKIASTIFYEESTQDPFWTLTASDFFVGVTLSLFEDASSEEINFSSISKMMDTFNDNNDLVNTYYNDKEECDSYHYIASTLKAPKETKASIISVAKQKIRLYESRESLNQLLSKNTFKIEDFLDNPSAIFVLAKDETKKLNSIASIFIEEFYYTLIEEGFTTYYNFVLHNIDIMDYMHGLLDILSSCIPRDIKFILGTRSIDLLTEKYGDYILTLSNMIETLNDEIIVSVSQEQDQEIIDVDDNPTYPILQQEDIKLFSLDDYLNKEKTPVVESIEIINEEPKEVKVEKKEDNLPFDVESLIKKIDERIKKIEDEQKKNNAQGSSVFDVFRTE